jgi:hypothetical protein
MTDKHTETKSCKWPNPPAEPDASQTQPHPSRKWSSKKYPRVSGAELAQLQKHWKGGFQISPQASRASRTSPKT